MHKNRSGRAVAAECATGQPLRVLLRETRAALARAADLEHQIADKRAILGEFGIDPDTETV